KRPETTVTTDDPSAEFPRPRVAARQVADVAPAELPRPRAARQAESFKSPRSETKNTSSSGPSPGEDVITALVAAGFKQNIAATATWACDAKERATIEGWTTAALRRCAGV